MLVGFEFWADSQSIPQSVWVRGCLNDKLYILKNRNHIPVEPKPHVEPASGQNWNLKWKPTSCNYWNVAPKPARLPLISEPKPPLEPASCQNWNLTLKPAYLLLDSEPKPCCNLLLYTWWLMHRVCTKLLKKS
jgi:hypothetical protein